jgi:hypothetical protein
MTRALAAALLLLAVTAGGAAEFGQPVRCAKGKVVAFPGLTVEFVGQRVVPSDRFPRGFRFWDYLVRQGETKKSVAWSDGTGDIGPVFFSLGGSDYVLERVFSEGLRRNLKDDEIVLWQKPAFTRARAAR